MKLEWLLTPLVIVCFAAVLYFSLQSDNTHRAQVRIDTMVLWHKWDEWNKKHCSITERHYGLTAGTGKFHYEDAATVYSCDDGIQYIISNRVGAAAESCIQDVSLCATSIDDQIPRL